MIFWWASCSPPLKKDSYELKLSMQHETRKELQFWEIERGVMMEQRTKIIIALVTCITSIFIGLIASSFKRLNAGEGKNVCAAFTFKEEEPEFHRNLIKNDALSALRKFSGRLAKLGNLGLKPYPEQFVVSLGKVLYRHCSSRLSWE